MRLATRDMIATGAVLAAVLLYAAYLTDLAPSVLSSTSATGLAVLVLGFVASAVAVVPGFAQLIHGNRAYLALTSLLGVAAFASGVVMVASENPTALAMLIGALVTLWAISTVHHLALARSGRASDDTVASGSAGARHATP